MASSTVVPTTTQAISATNSVTGATATTNPITSTKSLTETKGITVTGGEISATKVVTNAQALTATGALTNGQSITTARTITEFQETVLVGRQAKLGKILVDDKGMTLYVFDKDTFGKSNCTGDCLKNWPPLIVKSEKDLVAGRLITGKLATIKREDGTLQVTINAMPLYTYAKDKQFGDVTGQGIGDVWWTVAPDGSKINAK